MTRQWTYGFKIGASFALAVALALLIGAVAIYALRDVVASKDRVIDGEGQMLSDIQSMANLDSRRVAAARGYFISGEDSELEDMRASASQVTAMLARLREALPSAESRRLVDAVDRTSGEYQPALERLASLRRDGRALDEIERVFDAEVKPKRDATRKAIDDLLAHANALREGAKEAATNRADGAISLVIAIAIVTVGAAALIAFVLTRALSGQIGTAVGQIQSSSAELQAAANQQATGAKEQATAMNEITTTISELLATSRQIAESAQRVAHVAEQTAGTARGGDRTLEIAHESIAGIRRQVDQVVHHMLELGKKSQQIGSVLDIVSELAEQTNILAINATIEAAGAGEGGRRFAVVAEEIRRLSDRVAGSTKEIRGLIDDVRGAVNTTVMATETGSKAVDTGSRQFADVAASFKQIAGMVGTTTEAAREIELSTKQQTTAVEQVNVAIANVAQATRETEASSGQTLQTASQLALLSKDLLQLVQPQNA